MNFRNARFNAFGTIDCEVEHPREGWIPFTAAPDDPEPHGKAIHALALAAGPSAYVPPAPRPQPVPQEITFAQLLIGLVTVGWITEAEGENWLDGQLPAPVTQLIATLPQAERFAARARAKRPSTVLRGDALVNALAASQGKTQAELDDFFRTFSGV